MKRTAALTAIAALVSLGEMVQAQPAATSVVFVVGLESSAESRAMLSARLVKLNASNLHWYDDVNVLRVELPNDALAAVRADPGVALALPDVLASAAPAPSLDVLAPKGTAPPDPATGSPLPPVSAIPPTPPGTPLPLMPPPLPPTTMPIAPPISGGMALAPGSGIGVAATGLVDSLAGNLITRLFNRAPACKVSVAQPTAMFVPAGGDQVIGVKASGSCSWQALASVPWIKINSGMGVSGLGIVSYTVTAADGKSRAGSISIVATPGASPIRGKAIVVVMQAPKAGG
jgi:hypothetical protein